MLDFSHENMKNRQMITF